MELINEALQMAELVCGKVRSLPLPSFRKKTLLEDCERALVAIRMGDFAVALFNINVLADKLDTLREKGICLLFSQVGGKNLCKTRTNYRRSKGAFVIGEIETRSGFKGYSRRTMPGGGGG